MGCCRVWSFFIDLSFLCEQSPWLLSGLDSCVLAYWGSAAPLLSLQSFCNYAKGHCEAARSLFCSSDQCRTAQLRLSAVREVFWGMLRREHGGWRGINVSGSGYIEVLALEEQMWFDCVEPKDTCKASCVCHNSSRVRVAPSFQACLRAFICTFCMCVCIYVYVCMCADMYICIHMHVCCVYVHICVYTHVYVYVYAYLCIDCGSRYQCFSVWTVSCMHMCVRVHM